MLFQKLKAVFITSRPIFWAGPVFMFLLGVVASGIVIGPLELWGLFFVTFPMGVIVYGINDIADRSNDFLNERKGGVEGARVKDGDIAFLGK